jgi:hypothetical protein
MGRASKGGPARTPLYFVILRAAQRNRVPWAPEPLLLAAIIVLVIVSVWLFRWDARTRTKTTIGLMVMQVLKLVLPFMAATFVLPDPILEEGPVDPYAHHDRTRALTSEG